MIKTKFVFAVSMVAMLSCGVAWASAPSGSEETVADVHDVYIEATNAGTSTATNLATGIAGVTYVNRMVNTAGNAAQRAEDHAAAAGAYAIQAETAANEAKNALSGKLDNNFTANKNAIVTTDKDGKVTPVAISDTGSGTYITDVEVNDGVVTLSRGTPSISNDDVIDALDYVPENVANKETEYDAEADDDVKKVKYTSVIAAEEIAANAVAAGKQDLGDLALLDTVSSGEIDDDAVVTSKIANLNVTEAKLAANSVTTAKIKDAAVTVAKTSGIFGYIPTKSDGTGSAQIWVE